MIFVDTNVFVIDLRYRRDPNHGINRRFLDAVAASERGVTTLVNLLEVAGILSFNLNAKQLRELVAHFPRRYGVAVLPPYEVDVQFPSMPISELVDIMKTRCALGDAIVFHEVGRYAEEGSRFVSWDASHFQALPMAVQTPLEYLEGS